MKLKITKFVPKNVLNMSRPTAAHCINIHGRGLSSLYLAYILSSIVSLLTTI